MKKILFVCTGNTCRSSMAEGIFLELIRDKKSPIKNIEVTSAGLMVFGEERANEKAIIAMEEMGIDISSHLSKSLNLPLAHSADLILTMTMAHKEHILKTEPNLKDKVYSLKEYIGDGEESPGTLDIQDPYGMDLEAYRKTAKEIKSALMEALEKIEKKFFHKKEGY